jgi:Helix-turn-helix domain
MSKAQLVITAVVLEGRSKSEVARDYDVSRYWVQQLVKRYGTFGAAAFEPRSRRPHHNPRAIGDAFLAYYNGIRPHRALRRRTPIDAFHDRPKAFPTGYQNPRTTACATTQSTPPASSPSATTATYTTSG